jgi:hypothetical protein
MIKTLLICVFVALVLTASSSAQDTKASPSHMPNERVSIGEASGVKGVVADWQRVPIRNAYVLVHRDEGEDVHARTDANGRYAIPLKEGTYDVFISAKGFSPTSRKIVVMPDGMMVYDVVLEVNILAMNVD